MRLRSSWRWPLSAEHLPSVRGCVQTPLQPPYTERFNDTLNITNNVIRSKTMAASPVIEARDNCCLICMRNVGLSSKSVLALFLVFFLFSPVKRCWRTIKRHELYDLQNYQSGCYRAIRGQRQRRRERTASLQMSTFTSSLPKRANAAGSFQGWLTFNNKFNNRHKLQY